MRLSPPALLRALLNVTYTLINRPRFYSLGKRVRLSAFSTFQRPDLMAIGTGSVIREQAWLNAARSLASDTAATTLRIGARVYVGRFIHINAFGSVDIDDDVLISDRVHISDATHNYQDLARPIKDQGDRFVAPVRLCSGCWIGVGAVILPGVTIGRNAVVGANAVVTRSVGDGVIVGGVPARAIGQVPSRPLEPSNEEAGR